MKLGLALGPGAARGFAFAPIVQRMLNEGVKFGMAAGSSIGAGAAACLGIFENTEKLVEIAKGLTTTQMFLKLVDLAFPSKSLLQGKNIKRVLERDFIGNKCFADCAIPVIMTATSLKQQATVYIDEGRIVDGIMCSIGQPGALPPYKY